jgi:hypothetical protein
MEMSWKKFINEYVAPEAVTVANKMANGSVAGFYSWMKRIIESPTMWLDIPALTKEFQEMEDNYSWFSGDGFWRSGHWSEWTVVPAGCRKVFGKPFHPRHPMAVRFPNVGWKLMEPLCNRGEMPDGISGRELPAFLEWMDSMWRAFPSTRGWLRTVQERPFQWAARAFRNKEMREFNWRSPKILQWALKKMEWKGWAQAIPVGYGRDGDMQFISPIQMLDEVWHRDIPTGNENPEKVFRGIRERCSSEHLIQMAARKGAFPEMPWNECSGVVQIRDANTLQMWSRKLRNCSAGYIDAIYDGRCYLVTVGKFSMAEIGPDGEVYQHRGYENGEPSSEEKNMLRQWIYRRVRKEVKK